MDEQRVFDNDKVNIFRALNDLLFTVKFGLKKAESSNKKGQRSTHVFSARLYGEKRSRKSRTLIQNLTEWSDDIMNKKETFFAKQQSK